MRKITLRALIGTQALLLGGAAAAWLARHAGLPWPAAGLLALAAGLAWRWGVLRLLDRGRKARRAEKERFLTAIDNISQGLCFFDGKQRLILCNRRYAELYRLTPEQVRPGTTLREIVDHRFHAGTSPDMPRDEYLRWRDHIAVSSRVSDTVATVRDGRIFAIHHEPMPDGGWVATHEDITERRRALAQIEQLARTDALTGLPNRMRFRERLLELMAAGSTLALLVIDLDRFKAVNDTLGHPAGDELLRAAAARLAACVRPHDLVARLGGDEFAVIQTARPQPEAANALAARVVAELSLPFVMCGQHVRVGASVGVALAPDDDSDPDELLKKADLALYDAKAAGRGTFRLYRAQMVEHAAARHALERDLRGAELRGELELHFQPIVAIDGGRPASVEALLRWRHPQRGLVGPDQFIPLAEETGLIEPIGEWVLRQALAQAARWPADVAVAVNLSPVQMTSRLPAVVAAALRASGVAPARLELEITESVRLAEDSANLALLHELLALGVHICLDDFGVGYSSLSYLRSFPFRKIKVDRSFVRDVAGNAQAAAIVRAIATLGGSLGIAITAEGIEEPAQLERLRELGCDEAQGYFIGRPMPAAKIDAWLAVAADQAAQSCAALAA